MARARRLNGVDWGIFDGRVPNDRDDPGRRPDGGGGW
jgi:hypothetical protein